jgi:hypothetical protein
MVLIFYGFDRCFWRFFEGEKFVSEILYLVIQFQVTCIEYKVWVYECLNSCCRFKNYIPLE